MKFLCSVLLASTLVLTLAAVPAGSQELRGSITGVVRDNTGAVLPGVTVTATSPALMQPQVAVTGPQGTYRFPALSPGTYNVTFELPGFQTLIREGLVVNLNVTLTVNVELNIAGVEETITITGESPVVDVKSTTTGVNFTEDLLEDIPNARDIWAAMAQAPGFHMTSYDVGGSHTGTQTGFQTYGYSGQNRTFLEGINVTENRDANAGYFDYGSFEDFQLGGAGNMAETHGLGAFFNITIKSGGDDFHGDVYYDYESEGTISDNVPDELRVPGGEKDGFKAPTIEDPATGEITGLQRGNPIDEQTDLNLGVGGPIWKEHAWFYAGYRNNNQWKYTLGLPDPNQTQLINYTIKGTYSINSKNQIIGFWNKRTKLQAARDLSLACPLDCSYYQESNNKPWKVEWTSVLSDAAFLDVQYAGWFNQFPLYPHATKSRSTEGAPIGRIDLATDQFTGSNSYYQDRITDKPQFSGKLSYYRDDWKGTHNMKFGGEWYRERRTFHRPQPGNIFYEDRNGVPENVYIYNTPNAAVNDVSVMAFYAQDSWTIGERLTLNAGVRYDRYSVGWPDQAFTPEQSDFFPPVSVAARDIISFNNFQPRLGFAYDLTGTGRTVIKGFFGRFSDNPSTYLGEVENPVSEAKYRYRFNDLNGNMILDPGPDGRLDTSPELGPRLAILGGGGFVTVDQDMTNAWGQELSAHIEHELVEALSVRGSYVWKLTRNNWLSSVDIARANQYTIPYAYNDRGEDNVAGTPDDQVIQLFDRPAGLPTELVATNPQRYGLPEHAEDYHTIELALNRRFKDKWLFLTSFQHTWADDFRATGSSTSNLGVARNGTGYYWQPNRRRFDKQPSSWWNYKMTGRYVFPYEIAVAGSFKLQSGFNVVREISVRLPNAGSELIQAEPVENGRAPNVGILDLRVEKTFTVHPRWGKVTGMLDVFNLLNSDTLVNYRTRSGSAYREVIALLDPRIVRFGVRYEF